LDQTAEPIGSDCGGRPDERHPVRSLGPRDGGDIGSIEQRAIGSRGLAVAYDYLEFIRRTGPEGPVEALVAEPGPGVRGPRPHRGHLRPEAEERDHQRGEESERRTAERDWSPPDEPSPAREPLASILEGTAPRQREAIDPRTEPGEQRGQKG